MLTTFKYDSVLIKKVITGDESWVYGYDIETKIPSSQWKRPEDKRQKKALQVWWNVKILITVFFDATRLYGQYYLEVMRQLRKVISQKHKELWKNQLTHRCLCMINPPWPYSPDLAQWSNWSNMKVLLTVVRSIRNITFEVMRRLR